MTGLRPVIWSTSGRSSPPRRVGRAISRHGFQISSLTLAHRQYTKASEMILPLPLKPVITVSLFRGIETSIFFRLWTLAPRTLMLFQYLLFLQYYWWDLFLSLIPLLRFWVTMLSTSSFIKFFGKSPKNPVAGILITIGFWPFVLVKKLSRSQGFRTFQHFVIGTFVKSKLSQIFYFLVYRYFQ